ncbi:protein FAM149B1-like isoform X4 [Littorina saxatilis]|uniref:protein FAM149B1-like isoform X4 n=1 Tax=Littorina saxatilis TaxID=31220 RepID=UPI0038B437D4
MLSLNPIAEDERGRLLQWKTERTRRPKQTMTSRYVRKPVPLEIRAVVKTPQQGHVPLPEPADKDLPQDYIASVHNAIASYNTTPTSSGRSSPTNADTHSTLSVSQGGWTTGNTTERSSLDSSCYSLDEFDKQAASTVNQHFEEFESMLFEGPRETKSNAYRECQEWVTQFPHLRALGKQVLAPKDTGYHFTPTSTSISTTPRPSTSGTLEENDLSLATDTQGLTLSGRKVKATRAPPESTKLSSRDRHHDNSHISSEYDFLHEEVFAQDGVYEDIIAVDYKNIYEDNMEHKKQITPRRRRVGYPPITPNACVKDSVLSAAFDTMWFEIMSWMRLLMKKYAAEVEAKKELGALDHSLIHAPPRTSSFIYEQARSSNPINDILKVSTMPLVNRTNPFGPGPPDVPDSMVLMNPPGLWRTNLSRPPTVNQLRWRPGQGRSLDPLHERSKVQNSDESRSHQPNPQNALRVKQIMPTGVPTHHRLSSPPNPMAGRLPPLEPSAILTSSHCKFGNRASSAIDNKEGRNLAGREKSNNAVEFSRPSTTQAFNRAGIHLVRHLEYIKMPKDDRVSSVGSVIYRHHRVQNSQNILRAARTFVQYESSLINAFGSKQGRDLPQWSKRWSGNHGQRPSPLSGAPLQYSGGRGGPQGGHSP